MFYFFSFICFIMLHLFGLGELLLILTYIFFPIQCNVTQISEKMNRYGSLIKTGLMAFNYFAILGQMPIV
jgi:hypothetical protein